MSETISAKVGTNTLEPRPYALSGELRLSAGMSLAGVAGKTRFGGLTRLYIRDDAKPESLTVFGIIFDAVEVFIDRASGMNQGITIDNCEFRNGACLRFTSGLRNSKITNNLFTGYTAAFGIYGYNYDGLVIANNEFVDITGGMHIDAQASGCGNLLVEQNYLKGLKRMGLEFQSAGRDLIFQDNFFEHPNLSSVFHDNDGSMAFSLILDKSSNITIRRNTVIAPERPDGVGCRIGFEVGGDNTLVEDNYVNGINHVVAVNDGVGTCSVTVRNNQFIDYLQAPRISFPCASPLRSWTNTNNGPGVKLSWDVARGRPYRNRRFELAGTVPPASAAELDALRTRVAALEQVLTHGGDAAKAALASAQAVVAVLTR